MNFAEQIQSTAKETEARDSITITRLQYSRIADKVSRDIVDDLEKAAERAGQPESMAPLATLMTNILLIAKLEEALFGEEEDK